jgi:GT2 family glycosyltransferase/ADP-heptose:LPS heptosyltransferase
LLRLHTPREGVEYILSDNASTDLTQEFLANCNLPDKTVVFYPENLGYQVPHNEALKRAKGEFFIVMNNDVHIDDNDWLLKLLDPLKNDGKIGIVGAEGNPDTLDGDGNGHVGGKKDYVEGSLLAARTHQLRKYGLFSPAMYKFYFEDSDLSLRFRQMGFELAYVKIKHKHFRGTTANSIPNEEIRWAQDHNRKIWKKRWESFLRNRQFTNRILVKANSAGIGDVLAVTPAIEALRQDHPTADIVVETTSPEIYEHNPNVKKVIRSKGTATIHTEVYDRVVDLMPTPHEGKGFKFASYRPFCIEAEEEAATKLKTLLPQLYLTRNELNYGAQVVSETAAMAKCSEDNVIGISSFSGHPSWQGRSWNPREHSRLVKILVEKGFGVVEVGHKVPYSKYSTNNMVDKTSLREFFSIIANLKVLITIDSLAMWVAQAFKVPSFVIFGATEPIAKIIDFSNAFMIRNEGLSCLGCYQRKGDPGFNVCEPGHEACMHGVKAEQVYGFLVGQTNGASRNFVYLQEIARKYYGERR